MIGLGWEGLKLIRALNDNEKEQSKTSEGLFKVLSENFKPQHSETLVLLQYSNLIREER